MAKPKRSGKKAKRGEPATKDQATEISEPRIFELMYLEKKIKEAALQVVLQGKTYDERIAMLQNEKRNVTRQWEVEKRRAMKRLVETQTEIEEKHCIKMYEWGYDDVTGVMSKHPPEVLAEIHQQIANQRKQEQESAEGDKSVNAPVAEA